MSFSRSDGHYRVRTRQRHERSVPDEVNGPRFSCLADASLYAAALPSDANRPVIIEKLAAAGCWLQLACF